MGSDFHIRREDGFTMIELLTVVVIVGLLAAIAVPAFFGQRDRALDVQAQASARAAQSAAMDVSGSKEGGGNGNDGLTVAALARVDESLRGVDLSVEPFGDESTFSITVRSETGNTFEITQYPDGNADLTCASADRAGCPADGTWD
jgi:type IV pilus assembly protein PilA